ncbi:MAG: hypothetical protein A2004_04205 [Spirochaetes bacterium GWC1_61_12]|nr:MAG: hypothetical protein A2Y37_03890 [Spirochaetes bacterium GWB1_60_80]OHD35454.1 MAG: hypothetical protein A2004_04205 [Spirochaetes bacterium GWC1_61_12]OHD61518.1 MAG: hypothetical protein A2Y32_09390 [Spirochaetes bacterium GWF1_60_12]
MLLVTLTVFVIILAFALFSTRFLSQAVLQRGQAQLEARLQAGVMDFRVWLAAKSDALIAYGDSLAYVDYETAKDVFLAAVTTRGQRDPEIYSIYYASVAKPGESGGFFLDSSGWVPGDDYDWTGRPWFTRAAATGALIYDEPYVDADTGQLVFTLATPIRRDGRLVGVLGADIFMTTVTDLVAALQPTPSARTFLINSDNLYVTNTDAAKVMAGDFFEDTAIQLDQARFMEASLSVEFLADQGLYVGAIAIPDLGWRLVSFGQLSDIIGDLASKRWLNIGFAIGIGLLALVLVFFAMAVPVRYIRDVATGMAMVASGGGDLQRKLDVRSHDEIGELAFHFNSFTDYLATLIRQTMVVSDNLKAVSAETRDASVRVAQGLDTAVQALDGIISTVRHEATDFDVTSRSVNLFFDQYSNLQGKLLSQSASVEQTAAAMVQISRTMDNVAILGKKGQDLVVGLNDSARKGGNAVNELAGVMQDISRRSEAIAEFTKVIGEIAERTNMLAMNAAIEAAHAGETGKGFAVVADEIRKLAESANTESAEISRLIGEINLSIAAGLKSSNAAQGDLARMIVDVEENGGLSREISAATAEEAKGGDEILRALQLIRDANAELKLVINQQHEEATGIRQSIMSLQQETEVVAGSIGEQGAKLNELSNRVHSFNDHMDSVADEAAKLACIMENFKLEEGACP